MMERMPSGLLRGTEFVDHDVDGSFDQNNERQLPDDRVNAQREQSILPARACLSHSFGAHARRHQNPSREKSACSFAECKYS
jgi:hypothetical protein